MGRWTKCIADGDVVSSERKYVFFILQLTVKIFELASKRDVPKVRY
jgi:hypothetical protein